MSHALDIEALRKRFAPAWQAYGEASVSVLYDSLRAGQTAPAKFVRFTVIPSGSKSKALGGNRTRTDTFGKVWMQVAIPKDDTVDTAWKLADKAATIFKRWSSSNGLLRCLDSETDTQTNSTHFIVTVKVTYEGIHYT